MTHPISGKHAIEVAVFVVAFERPFSETTLSGLMGLQEALRTNYPTFSPINALAVHVQGDRVETSRDKIAGVMLQNLKEDGRPLWSLRVNENTIVLSCFDYEKWETTSKKALADLCNAAIAVVDEKNPLAAIAFQVIDRWSGPTCGDAYDIKQVFNTRSPYLTKQATLSGCLWHVHQGWFEPAPAKHSGKILNVLNLSTNETPTGILTTVDHMARMHFSPSIPAEKSAERKFLSEIFNLLHDKNKNIIKELINSTQRKAIGL